MYLCIRNHATNMSNWCVSSAWLECLPVTQEVTGSSPVRTAKKERLSVSPFCVLSFYIFFIQFSFLIIHFGEANGSPFQGPPAYQFPQFLYP